MLRLVASSGFFPYFIDGAIAKAALFALDERGAYRGYFGGRFSLLHLTLADQFTNNFAFVAEMSGFDLGFWRNSRPGARKEVSH